MYFPRHVSSLFFHSLKPYLCFYTESPDNVIVTDILTRKTGRRNDKGQQRKEGKEKGRKFAEPICLSYCLAVCLSTLGGVVIVSLMSCEGSPWENFKCCYRKEKRERQKERCWGNEGRVAGAVKGDRQRERGRGKREEKCIRWMAAPLPWCFARGRRCIMFIERGTVFFHCCARPLFVLHLLNNP